MTLGTSLRRSWPWWTAGGFLVAYELLGVVFGWPLLSHMVWADSEAYPPLSAIVSAVFLVLAIHFWIDRSRWVLPVGFGLIAIGVWVYETGSVLPAYAALVATVVGVFIWSRVTRQEEVMGLSANPKREPVLYAGLATVIAALAGAYGLELSSEEITVFISVVVTVASFIARQKVTPTEPK